MSYLNEPYNLYSEVEKDARDDYLAHEVEYPEDDRPTRAEAERDADLDRRGVPVYLGDDEEEF